MCINIHERAHSCTTRGRRMTGKGLTSLLACLATFSYGAVSSRPRGEADERRGAHECPLPTAPTALPAMTRPRSAAGGQRAASRSGARTPGGPHGGRVRRRYQTSAGNTMPRTPRRFRLRCVRAVQRQEGPVLGRHPGDAPEPLRPRHRRRGGGARRSDGSCGTGASVALRPDQVFAAVAWSPRALPPFEPFRVAAGSTVQVVGRFAVTGDEPVKVPTATLALRDGEQSGTLTLTPRVSLCTCGPPG